VAYADAQHLKGSVNRARSAIAGHWNTEKLQIVEILGAAQMLQQAEQNLAEQEVKLREKRRKRSASSSAKTAACASPSPAWWRLRCFRRGC
jgi:hypothetical protein